MIDKIGLKNKIKWLEQSKDYYSQFLVQRLKEIYGTVSEV